MIQGLGHCIKYTHCLGYISSRLNPDCLYQVHVMVEQLPEQCFIKGARLCTPNKVHDCAPPTKGAQGSLLQGMTI